MKQRSSSIAESRLPVRPRLSFVFPKKSVHLNSSYVVYKRFNVSSCITCIVYTINKICRYIQLFCSAMLPHLSNKTQDFARLTRSVFVLLYFKQKHAYHTAIKTEARLTQCQKKKQKYIHRITEFLRKRKNDSAVISALHNCSLFSARA